MACLLQKDPANKFDFIAPAGPSITVKIISTTPNVSARFTKAELNKKSLLIQNGDTVTFAVQPGVNTLDFVIHASSPNCIIQILEDCGAGKTQVLDQFPYDPSDPVVGYSIFGTSAPAPGKV
jgi:hypothetical protein